MPTIQVLIDAKGAILGTAQVPHHAEPRESHAPVARLVARGDQRVVDMRVTDAELRLDADALLKVLKEKKPR